MTKQISDIFEIEKDTYRCAYVDGKAVDGIVNFADRFTAGKEFFRTYGRELSSCNRGHFEYFLIYKRGLVLRSVFTWGPNPLPGKTHVLIDSKPPVQKTEYLLKYDVYKLLDDISATIILKPDPTRNKSVVEEVTVEIEKGKLKSIDPSLEKIRMRKALRA